MFSEMLSNLPQSDLMREIRKATMIGTTITFSERQLGEHAAVELLLRLKRGNTAKSYTALLMCEQDAIAAIKKFMHEVT